MYRYKFLKGTLLIVLLTAIGALSCSKKIDDAYQNPNAQVVEPIEQLLPSIIANFCGGANGSNIQLIDTTPGSPFAKEDAPVALGGTFSDFEHGIHMTTVATNDSPRYMDVVVNFGQFPANQRPSLSLAASGARSVRVARVV